MRTRALVRSISRSSLMAAAALALSACNGDNVHLTDAPGGDGAGADAVSNVPVVTFPTAVKNGGDASVDVSIAAPGGDFAVAFESGALAGSDMRDATVTYTPSGLGSDSGSAAITVTGAVCGAKPTALALTGKGLPLGSV